MLYSEIDEYYECWNKKNPELFVAKADELKRRELVNYFGSDGKVGMDYHVNDDGTGKLEIIGPDEDVVLAFSTTIRLFLQQGEPISFRSLSKLISKDKVLSRSWKEKYFEAKDHLNVYLDECPVKTEPPSQHPTRREIIDIILNGDIFHVKDQNKRDTFEKWQNSQIQFTLYINEFVLAIDYVAQIIFFVADLAKTELEKTYPNDAT